MILPACLKPWVFTLLVFWSTACNNDNTVIMELSNNRISKHDTKSQLYQGVKYLGILLPFLDCMLVQFMQFSCIKFSEFGNENPQVSVKDKQHNLMSEQVGRNQLAPDRMELALHIARWLTSASIT